MKRRLLPLILCLCLLSGCARTAPAEKSGLTIVATTYPIYLFASGIAQGVEDVSVERLDTGSVSCLHDYTLSVNDMKKLEGADVIALNGAGLEDFLEDALAASDAAVIDCSVGVELLPTMEHEGHDGHDHEEEYDPHYWMDPQNARIMAENLCSGLSRMDPEHAGDYERQALTLDALLDTLDGYLRDDVLQTNLTDKGIEVPGLITFHDGFQYFARAYNIPLLAAIEEEAGSEASAREIVEITELVTEYNIPAIFTEVNGSDATARAIARETGCQVVQLTMLMDELPQPGGFGDDYCDGLAQNMRNIVRAFAGGEVSQ